MPHPLYAKHQDLLTSAVYAIESRGGWSAYSYLPAGYGDNAFAEGAQAFEAYRDAQFYLDQPGVVGRGGGEVSPWGLPLNVSYPKCSADALIAAGKAAMPAWVKAGPDDRAGVCAEILARLNAHSMEIAHAVMHTTGMSFPLAFLSGGPNAQERGLEAVAWAWREMKHIPYRATWQDRPQDGHVPVRLEKRYMVAPRGVALVIAGAATPTWNAYPALFASLATGNPVIVKPHPDAILPLAITVALARLTLKEAGFDANLVSLLVDTAAAPVAKDVALKPDIRLIDYTGNGNFGRWLEENARQARVFAQMGAVNCVVVDSTNDYPGMLKSIALGLSLAAGQHGVAPRLILVARDGVHTPDGVVTGERFGEDLSRAVGRRLEDHRHAFDVLGAIRSTATLDRLEAASELTGVVRESVRLPHPDWPAAHVRTPLLLKAALDDAPAWMDEWFGPISFIVRTSTPAESIAVAERVAREKGALTLAIYSTNEHLQQLAEDAALRTGVALALNLTGSRFLDQAAAFSDFQGSGLNPAANSCIVDGDFVSGRFTVVQSSRPAA